MNQKLQAIPQQAAQPQIKDWTGAIASLSVALLDIKKEISVLQKQMQDAFTGFMQLQNIYNGKFEEIEKRLPAVVTEEPKAA